MIDLGQMSTKPGASYRSKVPVQTASLSTMEHDMLMRSVIGILPLASAQSRATLC